MHNEDDQAKLPDEEYPRPTPSPQAQQPSDRVETASIQPASRENDTNVLATQERPPSDDTEIIEEDAGPGARDLPGSDEQSDEPTDPVASKFSSGCQCPRSRNCNTFT
jgi:hypothetical protein